GGRDMWGFGYGFQRVLYNKFTIKPSPFNRRRVISYGIKFLHLNRSMEFDKTFNLLTRLNVEYGKRFRFLYLFAGVSVNYFIAEPEEDMGIYGIRSTVISTGSIGELDS